MNKKTFVKVVSKRIGLDRELCNTILNEMIDEIKSAVIRKEVTTIDDFTFFAKRILPGWSNAFKGGQLTGRFYREEFYSPKAKFSRRFQKKINDKT
jgi:hypothetical protein